MGEANLQTVLHIGAEGGSLRVEMKPGEPPLFSARADDQSLAMIGEGDATTFRGEWGSWDAALARLDRYPWRRLHPCFVDPAFAECVWAAVRTGSRDLPQACLEAWSRCCGVPQAH